MFTIIGGDGKEYGPVDATEITKWIAGGRANLQTKARRVGDTDWRTLGDFQEFQAAALPPALPPVAPNPASAAYQGTAAEIATRLAPNVLRFDFSACCSQGLAVWQANLLPLVGVTLLVILAQMFLSFVPLVSLLNSLLLGNVFMGGLYFYYLGKSRGEPRTVGDGFAGFTRAIGPLMLSNIIIVLTTMVIMMIFAGPFIFSLIRSSINGTLQAGDFSGLNLTTLAFLFLAFIPLCYLTVSWIFTVPLIIDRGLSAWTAMEVSRRLVARCWFRIFFLCILTGLIACIGIIGLFIGILFTIPLGFAIIVQAYEALTQPPQA